MRTEYFWYALGTVFLPVAIAVAETPARPNGIETVRVQEDVTIPGARDELPPSGKSRAVKSDGRSASPDEEPDCE